LHPSQAMLVVPSPFQFLISQRLRACESQKNSETQNFQKKKKKAPRGTV